MTEILSPHTGASVNVPRLLSAIMEWTTEPPILAAMVKAERANLAGLALLADLVVASRDNAKGAMDERQVAASVLSFLVNAEVRGTVARYVSVAHSIPYDQAKDDLWSLREYLAKTYGMTKGQGIPTFFAPDPEPQEVTVKWPDEVTMPQVGDALTIGPDVPPTPQADGDDGPAVSPTEGE